VIDWFRQIVGFHAESMGLLVSGGSMAALTALVVARHAKCGFNIREIGLQGPLQALFTIGAAKGMVAIRRLSN
jgi:aromatic-L-amino-acid/L-tryptophan decarboxylase